MVFVYTLKNQISNLNEELMKKDEKINELKKIKIRQILPNYKIILLKILMN